MNTGDVVVHPQWGTGTVLFDKEHCIGIRFLEHGQVNFSQEEWQAQHSPPERFRGVLSKGGSGISDLEYALASAVEAGDLTEADALNLYNRQVHPLEVKKRRQLGLDDAYAEFQAHPDSSTEEDAFYHALLRYIAAVVGRNSTNMATHYNIEDAIQESALEVWQRLPQFDSKRSSLRTWVNLITLHNIRDMMRSFRVSRGNPYNFKTRGPKGVEIPSTNRVVRLDEEAVPAVGTSADAQIEQKEFILGLSEKDRAIVQMLQDGLTQKEIAQALKITQPAIAQRLARLRQKVKP